MSTRPAALERKAGIWFNSRLLLCRRVAFKCSNALFADHLHDATEVFHALAEPSQIVITDAIVLTNNRPRQQGATPAGQLFAIRAMFSFRRRQRSRAGKSTPWSVCHHL